MSDEAQTRGELTVVDAIVVGSGFAGLYSIHKLRNELGLTVQAFDNAGDVGGTWYWNTYPGARSDTEVNAYCYSFDKELFHEWKWSERYPEKQEIRAYLRHVADKYDLRRSILFNTQVESATWDEENQRWLVTANAVTYAAQFLVEAVGLLSATKVPHFPGQERFRGEIYHTARWPHEDVDLSSKRVGVIGTGSSGIQVIAEIAHQVHSLTVFQRTPQWVVPSKHRPISPGLLQAIEDDYEGYWRDVLYSTTAFGFKESDISAESVSPEEREAAFEKQYEDGGGFQYMFAAFNDVATSRVANKAATDVIAKKIRETVKDPKVAELLTPKDLYAKRPLCCDNYYETYNRDNVELVDVKSDPIAEITETGIRTESGRHIELDVIVLATGFDAVSGNQLKIHHEGRNGVTLRQAWHDRPRTYLGLISHGFPNLFMIYGPMGPFTNQPPLHEAQVNWVAGVIEHVRNKDLGSIEPTLEAQNAWIAECDEIANQTLFAEVNSWINGSNIPGKPVTNMFFMAGSGVYLDRLQDEVDTDYRENFVLGRSSVPA
ncbi:flavin-containing monooxygenase [Blastococcus sp. PRF04-17]|uniref:flavin-containing monooxygenase n=1 Tax=Blastococcus sp. PRF04-17 TaxID=2933797 RepID=UPI001FF1B1A8|nr:NAD(P)/FAD-dependent oxidoreductase [Blastococcus sp. PRF04-17]UOY02607.1 NAD(P)/FAD-dependent oxidoreductase [Blastococcus sp. PRF04-17]